MDTALPGAWGLFRHMQEYLRHVEGERLALTRGVHQAIEEFHLLTEDQSKCPTSLYELTKIHPTMDVYHDVSGYMRVGDVLL